MRQLIIESCIESDNILKIRHPELYIIHRPRLFCRMDNESERVGSSNINMKINQYNYRDPES